jgi:hypothetical protein
VAARNLELPIGTVSARVKMLIRLKMLDLEALRNGPKSGDGPATSATATESFEVSGDSAELFTSVPERVQSLDDLIRVCKVDTTEWEVERFVCNKWEMGSKDADGKAVATPLFQVKAWLKRRRQIIAAKSEIAQLLADAKAKIHVRGPMILKRQAGGVMLEPSIPDLHVGKLAWAEETGDENYDSKIAERLFEDALAALLQRTAAHKFERILFPVGNDLLHSDTKQGTTTSGTPLDTDSRYHKSFLIARRMLTRAIDHLRSVAPVHVLVIPGNHDTLGAWHIGESLDCYFHKCKDVTIDNAPTMRKYHQFGKVMLMFTHGNRGKLADYPLLMATEQPKMFGETVHREAHTGDKHQLRVQEHRGVKVRISPALCAPDAWHSENHFVGMARSAEAFVWHREEGLIGTAHYTVPAAGKVA